MKFFQRLCEAVTSALGLSKLSEWGQHDQHSIFGDDAVPSMDMNIPSVQEARSSPKMEYHAAPAQDAGLINKMTTLFPAGMDVDLVHTLPPSAFPGDEPGPIFKPPNASPGFLCDYSAMKGWKHAGGVGARGLWLNHPNDAKYPFGGVYDIFTDYDDFSPIGITRKASTVSTAWLLTDQGSGLVHALRQRAANQRRWLSAPQWWQSLQQHVPRTPDRGLLGRSARNYHH